MEKIRIAKVVNVVGIKGEVKLYHYSDYRERFEELDELILKKGKSPEKTYQIEKVRYQGDMVILKLRGIDDRNEAETLRDCDVFITEADLRELPEDTYYLRDLIGMKVIDEGHYGEIGTLKDVIQNSAQDIYVVKRFKFKKEDGTEIEFKPDAVEEGLVIPMLRPDGVPYYQLIDYDTIDFILEQFISKRLLLGRRIDL